MSPPAFCATSPFTSVRPWHRCSTRTAPRCTLPVEGTKNLFPPTVESTRAYLAATRPAPIEQKRLEQLLALPMAPEDAMLLLAARLGDYDTVSQLLASPTPPNVNVQDREGSTPAMRAASRGHVEVVRLLLNSGKVDLNITNNWGYDVCIYVGSVKNSMNAEYEQILGLLDDPRARAERRWTQRPKRK